MRNEEVIGLMAKNGKMYIVRINEALITEIISVDSKKPEHNSVPDGVYQTEGGLMVRVESNRIGTPGVGRQPKAIRVPLSGVAKIMAIKRSERKREIAELRMAGKI